VRALFHLALVVSVVGLCGVAWLAYYEFVISPRTTAFCKSRGMERMRVGFADVCVAPDGRVYQLPRLPPR
jgi:hypothetical protein